MARALTILVTFAAAVLFAALVPVAHIFDALQPAVTALSIMVAAIFVRLNRGMPTLEWKSVDLDERRRLTSEILSLSKEYGLIIGIVAATLLGLVTLSLVGKTEVMTLWPDWAHRAAAGAFGAAGALCSARMAYVVWRDIDIVRLQKSLIDSIGAREATDVLAKRADDKIADIRAAALRRVEVPPPKAWGE